MSTRNCHKCNQKYIFNCRFNHKHDHESILNKYCLECDKCQLDTPEYDHCFYCNTVCTRDLNNNLCDTCNNHDKDRLINCELCLVKHSNNFYCSKCNTCNWKTNNKYIKHCNMHDMCHTIDSKNFITCYKCNKCVETINNEGLYCIHCNFNCKKCNWSVINGNGIDGYCKKCYPTVNNRYCTICDKVHSQSLNQYKHCLVCKKGFKWFNIFKRAYHSDCYAQKYDPNYHCHRTNNLLFTLFLLNLSNHS